MSDAIPGRCIGLIGGLGVGAAVHYYRELAKAHAARGRVLNLVMAHADVNRVLGAPQAGDKDGLAEYAGARINRARGRPSHHPGRDRARAHLQRKQHRISALGLRAATLVRDRTAGFGLMLRSEILHVHISAEARVVGQVPTRVIGIFVDHD